ncbi:baseplate wedge subunit and tail pin [Aeromonas phage Aswh_1]|nr:baseplate wedge subunit and tail pin [Aeromonas phage Aswh_1]
MITIFQQPQNITYYAGSPYTFTIAATTSLPNAELKYSWSSSSNGTSWADVIDPSAASDKLKMPPTNPLYSNKYFRVKITEVDSNTSAELSNVTSGVAMATPFDGRTSVDPSRAREGSKIRSRRANDLEFIQETSLDGLATTGNIGSATLQDASRHTPFPTIQNAIMDAANVGRMNNQSVIINLDNRDPSGVPQSDLLTFSGAVASDMVGSPTTFDIFGTRLTVADGTSETSFRDAVYAVLQSFKDQGLYIKDLSTVGVDSISFTYKDMRDHTPQPWAKNGINMAWVVGSPASYGNGYWERFLTEDKVLADSSMVTLYYWKKIG